MAHPVPPRAGSPRLQMQDRPTPADSTSSFRRMVGRASLGEHQPAHQPGWRCMFMFRIDLVGSQFQALTSPAASPYNPARGQRPLLETDFVNQRNPRDR